jgi:hypothetical protein
MKKCIYHYQTLVICHSFVIRALSFAISTYHLLSSICLIISRHGKIFYFKELEDFAADLAASGINSSEKRVT